MRVRINLVHEAICLKCLACKYLRLKDTGLAELVFKIRPAKMLLGLNDSKELTPKKTYRCFQRCEVRLKATVLGNPVTFIKHDM